MPKVFSPGSYDHRLEPIEPRCLLSGAPGDGAVAYDPSQATLLNGQQPVQIADEGFLEAVAEEPVAQTGNGLTDDDMYDFGGVWGSQAPASDATDLESLAQAAFERWQSTHMRTGANAGPEAVGGREFLRATGVVNGPSLTALPPVDGLDLSTLGDDWEPFLKVDPELLELSKPGRPVLLDPIADTDPGLASRVSGSKGADAGVPVLFTFTPNQGHGRKGAAVAGPSIDGTAASVTISGTYLNA